MSRPLRIEYHDAWYHVMNRGANRKLIFNSDKHRNIFLSLLREIVKLYSIEIHSYCLMGNHYHLLIRTPFPNLSKAMQHLNGIYTQKFNQIEGCDGALFRGRYKAILIQYDSYLLQVSRYIHLNPTEANLCNLPADYVWSSYQNYINGENNPIVQTSFILNQIGGIQNYLDFMKEGIDEETKSFYKKTITKTILGKKIFIKNVLKSTKSEKIQSSPEDIKRMSYLPEIDKIVKVVAVFFNIEEESILKNINGQKNIYRLTAIYLSKFIGQHSYSKIANYFNTSFDGIRGLLRRYKESLSADKNIKKIIDILANSQI